MERHSVDEKRAFEMLRDEARRSSRKMIAAEQVAVQALYANAIPLDLLKAEQDRIGSAEQAGKVELETTEDDLDAWQDVLRTAI